MFCRVLRDRAPTEPQLQTKIWRSKHGFQSTIDSFNDRVKKLGLGVQKNGVFVQLRPIDSVLIHWPGPSRGWPNKTVNGVPGTQPKNWTPELRQQTWNALMLLKRAGRVKTIGVCNYSVRQLKEMKGDVPAILQVECHPWLQQKKLRLYSAKKGISFQAYGSLGSGDNAQKNSGHTELLSRPEVADVASEVGKTTAQVLLRWAIDEGMLVTPKSSNDSRIRSNMEIFDFTLNKAQREKLNSISSDGERRFTWKGVDPDVED